MIIINFNVPSMQLYRTMTMLRTTLSMGWALLMETAHSLEMPGLKRSRKTHVLSMMNLTTSVRNL